MTHQTFIDLFAGCGGFSLGLMQAGWKGLFAIERDSHAFKSIEKNFLGDKVRFKYHWPDWLPQRPHDVVKLLRECAPELRTLRGKVDLVAGGPPCQGFSLAGRRNVRDGRNRLFESYVEFVSLVQPKFVLLENVHGIAIEFGKKNSEKVRRAAKQSARRKKKSYAEHIASALEGAGYTVFASLVRARDYGVPQLRPRYIIVGVRRDKSSSCTELSPFDVLEAVRGRFLEEKGLPVTGVTVSDAISDLRVSVSGLIPCADAKGFYEIDYGGPRTKYQQLMRKGMNGQSPNSLRLARHTPKTLERLRTIIDTCRPGVSMNPAERARLGMSKHVIVLLDGNKPSHTLTTLPDDYVHYEEPRILTVREYARLQSFPDWFAIEGKYTTGGRQRRHECPRYTQVGNAVPPFVAEALGRAISEIKARMTE